MAVRGRKPKPEGQAIHRNKLAHDWTEVIDEPFTDGPKLSTRRPGLIPAPWPAATKRWWSAISSMPHCVLWRASDWEFALTTAQLIALVHSGEEPRLAGEVRAREKTLGTTAEARRDLRIRYVQRETKQPVAADVTRLDDYRDL